MTDKLDNTGFLETDLYAPVRDFLVAEGYTVRSEVKDCDVAAVKDGQLVIVELKKHLSIELLTQAVKRQKLADLVYMAVPKPKKLIWTSKWKDVTHLIRRLELGLILVAFRGERATVEVVVQPEIFDRARSMGHHQKKRAKVLKEFHGRLQDANLGGSKGRKLMTAYRENAIQIACCLETLGPLSPKQMRKLGTDPQKTTDILYQNVYGWFTHLDKGLYGLSDRGKRELVDYPDMAEHYRRKLAQSTAIIDENNNHVLHGYPT